MQSNSRLASQVAAEAEVDLSAAQAAVYLLDLSRAGKTLNDAAALLRVERCDARAIARDWGIEFPDYTPAPPLPLEWSRVKRGRWELFSKSHGTVAEAVTEELSPGRRGYRARLIGAPIAIEREGSSAEVACRRLSLQIEREAVTLCGCDDVAVFMDFSDGREQLAPKLPERPDRMRQALAA